MLRIALLAAAVICAAPVLVHAEEAQENDADRLLIVNGNSGRVVYDDGRDDLFCVTRKICVGYTFDGRPIYRRTMHCR